jgi:hypothetical protein
MVIVSRPQRHVWVEGGDGAGQHSKGLFFVHTVMMARPCPPRQGVVTLRYMPRASSTCVPWYAHREFPRWGGQAQGRDLALSLSSGDPAQHLPGRP